MIKKKLREILDKVEAEGYEERNIDTDKVIAQIISAFEEEGWVSPIINDEAQRRMLRAAGYMNGAEFYQCFEKELDKEKYLAPYHRALQAAKRAAGLK